MPERRRIDVMLEPAYLDGVADRPIDDVRAMRDQCLEIETELSYVRRLAQARIDIVGAELERRGRGGSVGDLVASLPDILTEREPPRASPARSRLPQRLAPSMDITWRRGLEHLVTDSTLANLPSIPVADLRTTLDGLHELERQVSEQRRALHDVIQRLDSELGARHTAGPRRA